MPPEVDEIAAQQPDQGVQIGLCRAQPGAQDQWSSPAAAGDRDRDAVVVDCDAGAGYLLWLAWQALRPGGRSVFVPTALPVDRPRRLFAMGLVTNLLNPKIAVLYVSLLPQFVDPARGAVAMQSLLLGSTQIVVALTVNAMIVLGAGGLAVFLARRPGWLRVQRYLMGTVLAGLAPGY